MHDGTFSVPTTDTGYRKICGNCGDRWDVVAILIGRPRDVSIETCPPCQSRARKPGFRGDREEDDD